MKVFDLQCDQGHGFEGWFGSEEDYLDQLERGLLSCPVCQSVQLRRRPSAPRLNLGATAPPPIPAREAPAGGEGPGRSPDPGAPAAPLAELQARYLAAVRHVLANTEDVGARFSEEVRRIHYGEVEQRAIRGQADAQEREALREEGIEVFALPVPTGLDGPLQ